MGRHAKIPHHNQQSQIFPEKKDDRNVQNDEEDIIHADIPQTSDPSEPEQSLIDDGTGTTGDEGAERDAVVEEQEDSPQHTEAQPAQSPIGGYRTIDTAPKSGIHIVVSQTGADEGVRGFFKRSRFFKDGRWQMTGKWIEPISGKDILFEPRYWKDVQW